MADPQRFEIGCKACQCAVLVITAVTTAERDTLIVKHGWQNQSRGPVCPECQGKPVPRSVPAAEAEKVKKRKPRT